MDMNLFFEKIKKSNNGCWEWLGLKHPFGYGRFGRSGALAHRISYAYHNGPITKSQCVCHSCDNPSCVNPQHLFLGSRIDNNQDRQNKGRTTKGSKVTNSKLIEQQVKDIKQSTKSTRQLATHYGVSYNTIWSIRKGTNWSHVI